MQVGDIVTYQFISKVFKGVVTAPLKYTDACMVLVSNGDTIIIPNERLTKTGEHVDIASILKKLKEE